jgi:hypothetical protein
LRLYGPDDGSTALSLARGLIRLMKTGRALKMKVVIERRAALSALASVPGLALPGAAMTKSVDPILTAIERDRIAYVAFGASVNRTDEVESSTGRSHDVTQAPEDAYEAAIDVEEDGAMN